MLNRLGIKEDAIRRIIKRSQYPPNLSRLQQECITFLRQLAFRGSLYGEFKKENEEVGLSRLAFHNYLHIQTYGGKAGHNYNLGSFMEGYWRYRKGQGIVYHKL